MYDFANFTTPICLGYLIRNFFSYKNKVIKKVFISITINFLISLHLFNGELRGKTGKYAREQIQR